MLSNIIIIYLKRNKSKAEYLCHTIKYSISKVKNNYICNV